MWRLGIAVDHVLQLFARLEEGDLFGGDFNPIAGFGVAADARLALSYRTLQCGDRDAILTAAQPLRLRYKWFEVWRGDECVGSGINPHLPN